MALKSCSKFARDHDRGIDDCIVSLPRRCESGQQRAEIHASVGGEIGTNAAVKIVESWLLIQGETVPIAKKMNKTLTDDQRLGRTKLATNNRRARLVTVTSTRPMQRSGIEAFAARGELFLFFSLRFALLLLRSGSR